MKISAYIPVLFPSPAVSKTNKRILYAFFKRNSVHYVNLKQAIEKLETELLFLKDVNIRD